MKAILTDPRVASAIVDMLVYIVGTVATLAAAASPLIVAWLKTQRVVRNETEAKLVELFLTNAAAAGDEHGRAALKHTGVSATGQEKAAVAFEAFKQFAVGRLLKLPPDEAIKAGIAAKLPELRAKTAPPPLAWAIEPSDR